MQFDKTKNILSEIVCVNFIYKCRNIKHFNSKSSSNIMSLVKHQSLLAINGYKNKFMLRNTA